MSATLTAPAPEPDLAAPQAAALALVGEDLCRAFGVLPLTLDGDHLTVAVADAGDALATRIVRGAATRAGRDVVVRPRAVTPGELAAALDATFARPAAPPHDDLAFLTDPAWDLEPLGDRANPLAAQALPEDVARVFGLVPVAFGGGVLTLGTAPEVDRLALRVAHQAIERRGVRARVRLVAATPDELAGALAAAYGGVEAPAVLLPAPTEPLRLGERLVKAGVLSWDDLDDALEIQHRTGGRLGLVLSHTGMVEEDTLAAALADQLDVAFVDLERVEPDPAAVGLIPVELLQRHNVLPLGVRDGVLTLAMVDPLDDDAFAALGAASPYPLQAVLASDTQVDRHLQALTAEHNVDAAVRELVRNRPQDSAYKVLSTGQKRFFIALIVVSLVALALWPIATVVAFNVASVAFYAAFSLYRFNLIYNALAHDFEVPVTAADLAALDERELPVYTVLIPLYKEAGILPTLLRSLSELDYPATKLDVKILAEADDQETIDRFRELRPPPHFKLVVVPDALPKTKPKACNYGLAHARGELCVIFDAEDQPERDQLKKVVAAFRNAPRDIACIQCKLNYFNRTQNMLTRWFTTEYSMWFDVYLPGLDASDAPIPLGGTSNHFITANLVALGAWDPYNVAEDADLGIRMNKAGLKTAVVDSTTYEEANSDPRNWVRQRSRWVKGYIQTWLVHMRHPIALLRVLGPRRFLSFQLTVGGTFVGFLLNPIYWGLTSLWAVTEAGLIRQLFPGFVFYAAAFALVLGNFVFTFVNVAGAMGRGYFDLVKYALLSPVYWAMMSAGAWKGFIQLFTNPFYWEKTVHGLDGGHVDEGHVG